MKEDVDALSWGRVLEIGKLLREPADGGAVAEYARELVTIAQSNLSLASRLGMDAGAPAGAVLPSGMEVVEGGYAEAALQDAQSVDAASDAGKRRQRIELPVIELPSIIAAAESAESAAPAIEPEHPVAESVAAPVESVAEPAAEPVEQPCSRVDAPVPSEAFALDPAGEDRAASSPTEAFAPIRIDDLEEFVRNAKEAEAARQADDAAPSSDAAPSTGPAPSGEDAPSSGPAPLDEDAPSNRPAPSSDAAPSDGDESSNRPAPSGSDEAGPQPRTLSSERFARFRSLYESQDGSLCVFEDEHGHLVAVDASRLA